MNKFSTILATAATSAALLTTGVSATTAAPEAQVDTVSTVQSELQLDSEPAGVRDHCVGNKMRPNKPLINGYGKKIGHIELWYSSRNGGQKCVMTYNHGKGTRVTQATLWADDNRDGGDDRRASDRGRYEYYAGGAFLNQTNGSCVQFYGEVLGPNPKSSKDDAWAISSWGNCR